MAFPTGKPRSRPRSALTTAFGATLLAITAPRAPAAPFPEPIDFAGRLRAELAPAAIGTPTPLLPVAPQGASVPGLPLWLERLQKSRPPARAARYLPVVRAAFAAQGVPESLAWLAETESGFDPAARSPAGALGLFQLMPGTAVSLGLFLHPLDQRADPASNATAAAVHLRHLHARFGDWPLALAAYNAGEGAIRRALRVHDAADFAGIAPHLPPETRAYVPKVLATVQVRARVPSPPDFAPPGRTLP